MMAILTLPPFKRSQRMSRRSSKGHRRSPPCSATQLVRKSRRTRTLSQARLRFVCKTFQALNTTSIVINL